MGKEQSVPVLESYAPTEWQINRIFSQIKSCFSHTLLQKPSVETNSDQKDSMIPNEPLEY